MAIQTLINKKDAFEVVRDQIAQILADESANQMALAVVDAQDPEQWRLDVYTERANPWEKWLNDPELANAAPIINVWFESDSFDMGQGNVVECQAADGLFNIDCYGFAISCDDSSGGHIAGDEQAAREAARASRLVRNILMASDNTYLQLRPLVSRRWVQSRTSFQPQQESTVVQRVQVQRIILAVKYIETSPQYVGEILGCIHADIKRASDGMVIAQIEEGAGCVVKPPFVCESIYFNQSDWDIISGVWNPAENRVEPTGMDGFAGMNSLNASWNPPGFQPTSLELTICAPSVDPDQFPLEVIVQQISEFGIFSVGMGTLTTPDEILTIIIPLPSWNGASDRPGEIRFGNQIYLDAPYAMCVNYIT